MLGRECYNVLSLETYSNLFFFSIIIVTLGFFVGLSSNGISFLTLEVAYWIFWIGMTLVSLLVSFKLFVLFRDFINDNFYTPIKKIKEYWGRVERERDKIKDFLEYDIEGSSTQELKKHYSDLEEAEFSKEALAPYLIKWYNNLNAIHYLIQKDEHLEIIEEFEEEKEELQEEIKKLEKEKKQKVKEKKYPTEQKEFLKNHEGSIQLDATDFTEEQKRWLEGEGFQRTHQWCINKKDSVEFLIKPRHNESLSHAYLTGAIFDYVKRLDSNAKLSTTKTADIIFSSDGSSWAVEIETGKVHEKNKKQLLEKVKILNEKFPERWFFIVTNKNLLSKYRKLGETFDRSSVIERIDEIFSSKQG